MFWQIKGSKKLIAEAFGLKAWQLLKF